MLAEDPEHFWRGMCQKKEDLDKERELDKEKNPNGTGSRKEEGKTGDWLLFFVSVFFMCLFRNQGIYVFLFFVLAVCLFLRKKSVSQKLVYRDISAGGSFMVCFIRSDSNGVRRGKGRCEGDAVRANAAAGAHIS
mgnify:CR=1 FL=1